MQTYTHIHSIEILHRIGFSVSSIHSLELFADKWLECCGFKRTHIERTFYCSQTEAEREKKMMVLLWKNVGRGGRGCGRNFKPRFCKIVRKITQNMFFSSNNIQVKTIV